jgi:hypothetical protein
LVAGLADDLTAAGIRTFGPSAAAAQLEGSKKFMKVRSMNIDGGLTTAAWHCVMLYCRTDTTAGNCKQQNTYCISPPNQAAAKAQRCSAILYRCAATICTAIFTAVLQDICKKYNIPTAAYEAFTDPAAAKAYIQQQGAPIVVKTSGLAAGKGVTVAQTVEEACQAVDAMMVDAVFGDAGNDS